MIIGEIAGNKHPLLLLFKYLGATLTETWMRRWRIQYNQNGKKLEERVLDVLYAMPGHAL